jgi:hypothetical protein
MWHNPLPIGRGFDLATLQKKPLNVMQLKAKFDGVAEDAIEIGKRAGQLILDRALPLTPMETGALRESGRVEIVGDDHSKNIQVKVIFGYDDGVDYAAIVHEDLEPKKFTEAGTGPKYLETAVDQSAAEVVDMFAKDFENMLIQRFR